MRSNTLHCKVLMYLYSTINNTMTNTTSNIENALIAAKNALTKMIAQGLCETKYVFALSNMLCENYGLTQNQGSIIIEKAIYTI